MPAVSRATHDQRIPSLKRSGYVEWSSQRGGALVVPAPRWPETARLSLLWQARGRHLAEQVRAPRDSHRLQAAVHPDLGEYVLYVGPQGADGDVHLACHLPGALAGGDPAQHLCLAGREHERGIAMGCRVRHRVEDRLATRDL